MSIHLPPIAAAEPPAVPTTPVTGGNGSSFGQFLDKAGAHSEPAAASPSSQPASGAAAPAAASATTSQAAATADGAARDGGKGDTPPVSTTQPQAVGTAKSSASAAQAHASGTDHGKDGALTGDRTDNEKDPQSAAAPAVPGPIVPTFVAPVITATPPISAIVATASAAKTIAEHAQAPPALIANAAAAGKGAAVGPAERDPWIAQAANSANPQPAATATSFSKLVAGAQGVPSDAIPQTATQLPAGLPASPNAAPATIASTEVLHLSAPSGAITIAPPVPAPPPSAPPPVSKSSNKAFGETVSAEAAALLGRVSVLGTGQPRPQAASAPVPGEALAAVIGATLAPGSTAPGGQAKGTDPAPPAVIGTAAASGSPATTLTPVPGGAPTTIVTPATTATPLPPISGSVDLTSKFSAVVATPARGDATSTGGPKAKSDSHPTSAMDPVADKPAAAAPAETVTVTASAKAAADATLAASTSSRALTAADDDAADAHAANPPTVMPQPRVDATGTAPGVPTGQSAPETQANPIAALHSVTEQVAIAVKRGVKAGNDQIQINLEPASLGKISVRLDFAQDGRVSAVFSADRPDTLNLLNGDARSLEQSLRDAGLRADSGSLTFNLSGGHTGANARHFAQAPGYAAAAAAMIESDPLAALAGTRAVAGGLGHDGSLDIRV